MNELSRRVLKSIESAFVVEDDNGACLHQVLCENNKATRHRTDNQKIWVPFWGLEKCNFSLLSLIYLINNNVCFIALE